MKQKKQKKGLKVQLQLADRVVNPDDNTIEDLKKVFQDRSIGRTKHPGRRLTLVPSKEDLTIEQISRESLIGLYDEINDIHDSIRKTNVFRVDYTEKQKKARVRKGNEVPKTVDQIEPPVKKAKVSQVKLRLNPIVKYPVNEPIPIERKGDGDSKQASKNNTKKGTSNEIVKSLKAESLKRSELSESTGSVEEVSDDVEEKGLGKSGKVPEKAKVTKTTKVSKQLKISRKLPRKTVKPATKPQPKHPSTKPTKFKYEPQFIPRYIKTKYGTHKINIYQELEPHIRKSLTHQQLNQLFPIDNLFL